MSLVGLLAIPPFVTHPAEYGCTSSGTTCLCVCAHRHTAHLTCKRTSFICGIQSASPARSTRCASVCAMLRELGVLRSPPEKRPLNELRVGQRRLARAEAAPPPEAVPLIIGIGAKARRPLKLTVVALVELVGKEAFSSIEETASPNPKSWPLSASCQRWCGASVGSGRCPRKWS